LEFYTGTEFWIALGSILLIDLVLSGDNAIIIALASRGLPLKQRQKAILWGTFGAVFFRILLAVIATYLLMIPYLMCLGGLALIYIALKLLLQEQERGDAVKPAGTLYEAVKIILIADVVMSLDNVLAVAGVAAGNFVLLSLGIALSIPMVIWGSTYLLKLMDKYPVIIYAGAGVLAFTAGKMIIHDASLINTLKPFALPIEIGLTVFVLAIGYWVKKNRETT
jgi:YjbE family integral membrane protein